MNWGKGIIISFVLFAVFIGLLVSVCIRQDMPLVSANYYQEELAYQQQIERLSNAEQLAQKPSIQLTGQQLEIRFNYPDTLRQGELQLFRPSDSRMDKTFLLQSTAEGVQRFDLSQLPTGNYRVSMKWAMGNKEFYIEDLINL